MKKQASAGNCGECFAADKILYKHTPLALERQQEVMGKLCSEQEACFERVSLLSEMDMGFVLWGFIKRECGVRGGVPGTLLMICDVDNSTSQNGN